MPKLSNLFRLARDSQYRRTAVARLAMTCFRRVCKNVEFVGISQNGQKLILPIEDRVLSPMTIAHGLTDADEFQEVLEIAARHHQKVSGVMLEIGGNIGTTTVAACRHRDIERVISFEPDPSNYEYLVGNVALNGFSTKVQCNQAAVGAEIGSVTLQLSDRHRGAHRVLSGGMPATTEQSRNVDVPCTTIDNIIATNDDLATELGLVWIDVEGYEGFVMQGATELIKKGKACFVTEFWPHGMTESGSIEPYKRIVKEHFARIVDLGTNQSYAIDAMDELIAKYTGPKAYTNVLLLKG